MRRSEGETGQYGLSVMEIPLSRGGDTGCELGQGGRWERKANPVAGSACACRICTKQMEGLGCSGGPWARGAHRASLRDLVGFATI